MANDPNKAKASATYQIDWNKTDEEQLVGFVTQQYDYGKARRRNWEARTLETLAWLENETELRFDRDRGDLVADVIRSVAAGEDLPYDQRQSVRINSLTNIVLQRIAFLLDQPVTLFSRPGSSDDDDVSAALIKTKLLQYMFRTGTDAVKSQMIWALYHALGSGIIWIKPVWNPDHGEPLRFAPDSDEDPAKAAEALRKFQEKISKKLDRPIDEIAFDDAGGLELPAGRVEWEWRTGFDLTEPEHFTTLAECDWIIDSRWRSMEWLRHRFGDKATKDITPQGDSERWNGRYSLAYGEVRSPVDSNIGSSPEEMVLVHELWRPRRPWVPAGFRCSVVQNKLLHAGPHPYPHGELPFVPIRPLPSKRFRPPSPVFQLVGMQSERNKLRSAVAEHFDQTIAPKILQADDAGIPDDVWTKSATVSSVPRATVTENAFKILEKPSLPPYTMELDELYRKDMQDVGGVHDSSMGRRESASQSGLHARILKAGDLATNKAFRESVENAMSQAGQQSLWLYWYFVPTDRTVEIVGDGLAPEVLTFKGESLVGKSNKDRPGPNDFDAVVTLGGDLDERLDVITALTKLGYMSPERAGDRMQVLRLFGDQTPTSDPTGDAYHRQRARMEHPAMLRGDVVIPSVGDDDEVHIEEHDRLTTTPEWRIAVRKNAMIAHQMAVHRYAHLLNAAEKPMRAAMAQEQTRMRIMAEHAQGKKQLMGELMAESDPAEVGRMAAAIDAARTAGPNGPGATAPGGPQQGPVGTPRMQGAAPGPGLATAPVNGRPPLDFQVEASSSGMGGGM